MNVIYVTGALNSGVLFFNVSGVEPKETILQAELRLFRHKQRGIYNVRFLITVTIQQGSAVHIGC